MSSIMGIDKEGALKAKMASLGIKESDIRELFILASKKGGQKVNKTSSCVYLKHMPTGIEVKCQQERSQALNRFLARRILVDKIESLILGEIMGTVPFFHLKRLDGIIVSNIEAIRHVNRFRRIR